MQARGKDKGMDELKILVSQQIGTISTNFEEIETNLKKTLADYKGILVTADTVKESKKDVTELRKMRTSIDDEKKKVKKAWNQPYTEFENRCKALMALVDETIAPIQSQIEDFEVKEIEDKKEHLHQLYTENIDVYGEYLQFENTLPEKWANKSFSDKDYLYSLSEMKLHVRTDLDAIKSLNSEITEELFKVYAKSGNNLSSAISRNVQFLEDKNRVREQVKEEVREEVKATSQKPDIPFEKPAPIKQFEDLQNKINMVHFVVSAEDADAVEQFLQFSEITYRKE